MKEKRAYQLEKMHWHWYWEESLEKIYLILFLMESKTLHYLIQQVNGLRDSVFLSSTIKTNQLLL